MTRTHLLTATVCASLIACGGGDDSTSTSTSTAPAAATFADCFEVTAGVAYTMTDADGASDGVLLVKEPFEGVVRSASVELVDASNVRSAATYWSQESDGIRFWGNLDYASDGAVFSKTVHSEGFVLPPNLQAGQSAALSYTETISYQSGEAETAARQETWTFESFETLALGGKTFTDTCRIRTIAAQAAEDGPSTLWFAKGFGLIRVRHTNSDGAIVEESSLETITAQP